MHPLKIIVWLLAVAVALSPLAACTATPVAVCPEPVVYTLAEQQAVAAELRAIPAPCVTCRFMTDYAQERAMLRACQ